MKTMNKTSWLFLLSLSLLLLSCSQGAEESAIAKKITFTVSKVTIVLPNKLDDVLGQTCIQGGITGPRVRLRGSITWNGTADEGNLIPLVVQLQAADARLAGEFAGTVNPGDEAESLSGMFGSSDDFIPPDGNIYSTTGCYLDYGGLPKPTTELKGNAQLEVPVTMRLVGVVRNSNNEDTPFIKEVSTNITYVVGSVPIQ